MDNHLHVLVRLDPEVAEDWSDDEVVRRWGRLYPPRDKSRKPLADFRGVGSRPAPGHLLGGEDSGAIAKHQLVHEMPERTNFTAGQPSKTRFVVPSSRPGSRAWRFSTRRRSWRPVRTSI